ncbi:MAG: hypothetical protein AMK75_07155 [Planctomycetes bacterium SM23_65]|nr:MAG: hypothetical protein AMK75_07155 [Planctomycetes bacterium SM23_65]
MPRTGIAARPPRNRRGGRAFTLVELITVMAIMAILMAMIVGVVPRIQDAWRARITRTRLQAIVASLHSYAVDFDGKFPGPPVWASGISPIRSVTTTVGVNELAILFPGGAPASGWEYYQEAILYAALTSPLRRGPYYKGGGGQTVVGKDGTRYNLFSDGWERPIRYEYIAATRLLVRSVGKNGVRETGSDGDDIVYDVFKND